MYYMFIDDGKINGVGEFPCVDEGSICLEISREVFDKYIQDVDTYIYKDGKIVENPDYELIKIKKQNAQKACDIKIELDNLDSKRIRALCENDVKDAKSGQTWLEYYNTKAKSLREELASLESTI